MQRNRKGPAAKRQRGEDGAGKAVAATKQNTKQKSAKKDWRGNGVKNYWQKMGAEFEISSEEDKDEWSDSDVEDELIGDEIEIQADDQKEEQDTASAIVRRWKQAQKEQGKGEKRKLTEDDDEEELKDEFVRDKEHAEASAGEEEEDGENGDEGEGEDGDEVEVEEAEEEEPTEEVPRVRKGPGSVSFAMVLGQLLAPAGGAASEAAAPEVRTAYLDSLFRSPSPPRAFTLAVRMLQPSDDSLCCIALCRRRRASSRRARTPSSRTSRSGRTGGSRPRSEGGGRRETWRSRRSCSRLATIAYPPSSRKLPKCASASWPPGAVPPPRPSFPSLPLVCCWPRVLTPGVRVQLCNSSTW
jgi:hypothetical protein